MKELGNILTKYMQNSLAIAETCISDYAQMDLVLLVCHKTIFIVVSLSDVIQPAPGYVYTTGISILDHINTWSEPFKKVSECFFIAIDKRIEKFVINRGENV